MLTSEPEHFNAPLTSDIFLYGFLISQYSFHNNMYLSGNDIIYHYHSNTCRYEELIHILYVIIHDVETAHSSSPHDLDLYS